MTALAAWHDVHAEGCDVNESLPPIRVTDQDWRRLTSLLTTPRGRCTPEVRALLDEELARAEVVPAHAVHPNVVTMNSRVRFELGDGGRAIERTLVYPWDADPSTGHLSVLSPLGSVLLGLTVGDVFHWANTDGSSVQVRVLVVVYQPEAEGDWSL